MLIVGGVAAGARRPAAAAAASTPTRMRLSAVGWRSASGSSSAWRIVPGVSRSGATIAGALLMGCDKRSAAEFSFFLAIPTMAGAFAYDLYKNQRPALDGRRGADRGIGFVAAFVAGADRGARRSSTSSRGTALRPSPGGGSRSAPPGSSPWRSSAEKALTEHDPARKPEATFRDHAQEAAARLNSPCSRKRRR